MNAHTSNTMSLHEAAKTLVSGLISEHDAEVILSNAIEHGELHANIKRWATEQWEGKQLPGNLNRLETRIECSDLATWLSKQKQGIPVAALKPNL